MKNLYSKVVFLVLAMAMLFSVVGTIAAQVNTGDEEVIFGPGSDEQSVLILPAALEEIADGAFYGDISIYEVVLPDGIQTIGSRAFLNSSLARINLPDSLEQISDTAFGAPGSITVSANKGSYAYNWARKNGYIHDYPVLSLHADGYEPEYYNTENTYTFVTYILPLDSSITLEILSSEDNADLSFEWAVNDVPAEGAVGSSFTLEADRYTVVNCRISDSAGYIWSFLIKLCPDTNLNVYIENDSNILLADLGGTVTLSVYAECDVPVTYRWERDLPGGDAAEEISGATDSTLDVEVIDSGVNYRCIVTDEYGNFVIVRFSVYPNPHMQVYTVGDNYRAVYPGSREKLMVEVVCDEEVSFRWDVLQYNSVTGSYVRETLPNDTSSILTDPIVSSVIYTCTVSVASGYSMVIDYDLYVDDGLILGPDGVVYRNIEGALEIAGYGGEESNLRIPETVLNLPVTMVGFSAFAGNVTVESITLPNTITNIRGGAFYGTASLEQFEVPYGTQSIGALAFANSGLKTIYIPDTVESIEMNAFSGISDLVIYTPSGSYAEIIAEELDYHCEDSGSKYSGKMFTETTELYEEIQAEGEDLTLIVEFEAFEPISTEGINDEALLTAIEECNGLFEELSAIETMYEGEGENLINALSEYGNVAEQFAISFGDDSMTTTLGDYSFDFYDAGFEGLGDDYQVISSEMDGNGVLHIVVESSGQQFLISSSDDTFTISSYGGAAAPDGKQLFHASIQSSNDNSGLKNALQWLNEQVDTWLSAASEANLAVESMWNLIIDEIAKLNKTKTTLTEKILNSNAVDDNTARAAYKQIDLCAKKINKLGIVSNALHGMKKIYQGINLVGAGKSFHSNVSSFMQLYALNSHGHPLPYEEANTATNELVQEMLIKRRIAMQGFGSLCILNACDLVNGMSTITALLGNFTLAGAPAAWLQKAMVSSAVVVGKKAVVLAMRQFVGEVILEGTANILKDRVFAIDKLLHENVIGYVYDKSTGKPLKNVAVSCDGKTVYTNSEGRYSFTLLYGTYTLKYTKKGYSDESMSATISAGVSSLGYSDESMSATASAGVSSLGYLYMTGKSIIRGKVTDASTGKPISDATVMYGYDKTRTNSAGIYSFEVEPGTKTLKASAAGYISSREIMATCEANVSSEYNISLKKEEEVLEPNGYWDIRVDGLKTAARFILPIPADGRISIKISSNALVSYYFDASNISVFDTVSGKRIGYFTHIDDWSQDSVQLSFSGNVKEGQVLAFTLPRITKNTEEWLDSEFLCWYIQSTFFSDGD